MCEHEFIVARAAPKKERPAHLRKCNDRWTPNQSMVGIAVSNLSTSNSESKVLKNLLVHKNLMLCRAYGYGHKTVSLTIMNGSNPKLSHIILYLVCEKGPLKARGPRGLTYLPI